jgi:hypothetical protein
MEKSFIINEQQEQLQLNDDQLEIYNNREILREAKQLRQHKTKLEQRMKILEDHNKQLGKQLKRSKQLLFKEVRNVLMIISIFSLIFSLLHIIYAVQLIGILIDRQVIKIF